MARLAPAARASDFLIASNDCRDGTDRLLDALAEAGVLRHLPQPPMAALASAKGKAASVQWRALKAIWAGPERKAADWMLISDVDEFPVIHCGNGRFADLIAALPEGRRRWPWPGVCSVRAVSQGSKSGR
ncbi:glycosyltransferase family 2 protein [Gemmobacter sp. 24YEA27]|uniref:glycosyltransferase family 2 protein n=1 Tax=Gemmobacter sp. 24YEA27 TaxID=3040672 RepID=UPI0024B37F05|nr:glycosyltransferase family 2 protein [Gemmobacter sp. 24YEA27]